MSERSNRALVATTAVAAAAGCIATWKLYGQWQKIQHDKERNLTDHANEINPGDLAILARSGNYALKRSAEQVLSDRMVSGKGLEYLLEQCASDNQTQRKKAVSVVSMLSKTREFRPILIKNNVFNFLYRCIKMISSDFQVAKLVEKCYSEFEIEQTLKLAIVSLLELVSDCEGNLTIFFNSCKDLIGFLLELICDPSDCFTTDIRRLAVLILQQMMQHGQMRCNLISYGMIQRTTLCFLRTIGDVWLSRNCLQILVMHINLFEDYVTEEFLQEMAQLGIIPVLVGCLKSEDPDLIYWSTALIHEFLLKDLHRGVISKIPNLVKTLYQILINSESSVQRLILRIFCFLSINDDHFKKKLLHFKPLLKRLSVCLASGNNDLLYWSLLLVHDLAMMGKQAALNMVKANEELLRSVMVLTQTVPEGLCDIKLVAETLGFFCSCESLHKMVVETGCIKVILTLLKSESTELQFWASSLLLNLAMSSDDAREKIIKDGGIGLLLEMAVKESEMPQITAQASKILVMLGFSGNVPTDRLLKWLFLEIFSLLHSSTPEIVVRDQDAKLELNLIAGLESSIKIDNKERSPMKYGINMVTVDFLDFKISKGRAFDLKNPSDSVSLLAELKKRRQNQLVIMTTQGNINSFINEAQCTNIFFILEEYGLKTSILDGDGSWCIVAQADGDHRVQPIMSRQGMNSIDISLALNLAEQVNTFVQEDLLKPLLNILMSVPAGSNISKVPELEIISTLARHGKHQTVMLSTAGLLDYIAELIWCFACLETEQLSSKPLMIAHCVGAMKICHSLSTNMEDHCRLFESPVLGAIKSFLLTSCSVLLVTLREDADNMERSNARLNIFTPDEDIFIGSDTPRNDLESSYKNARYSASFSDRAELKSEAEASRNTDRTSVVLIDGDAKRSGSHKRHSNSAHEVFDDGSDLVSPFCADPKTQNDELQALIAQITLEKAFSKSKEEEGKAISAQTDYKTQYQDADAVSGAPGFTSREELNFTFQDEPIDVGARRGHNRESRLSERSKSSRRSESDLGRRVDDYENDNFDFDFDDFEEEDLPPIPDNDDDELRNSQGRGFFDMTRIASAQRMRSSSAFNPNEWPTTRSGCLSRTLSEAAHRAKSPLKDIASDLEDFDEAVVNLTNYALMATYFAINRCQTDEVRSKSDISRLVHILWCVLLGCKQENRIQWGMIISAIISQICTEEHRNQDFDGDSKNVKLDVEDMTSSLVISNDHLEVYNGNWTFESVSATRSVSKAIDFSEDFKGWYYEVSILSKGIMQIGWTSDKSLHEPEKGLGVGDNDKSVGFDGSRCRIWNGQGTGEDSQDNNYGKKWSIGDTVSCLLSADGDISFWLNGQDLGVGLRNIDTSVDWFPALSLSLDQQCKVNFGCDAFMYEPPNGFISIERAGNTSLKTLLEARETESLGASENESELGASENPKRTGETLVRRPNASKSPFASNRREITCRDRLRLDFSPKDLLDNQGPADVFEVLYFEVRCSLNESTSAFQMGFQSTIRNSKVSCIVKDKRLFLPNTIEKGAQHEVIHFEDTVGCGLIWPLRKIFFTADGIGSQFSVDLADWSGSWRENLDEIIPYFSKKELDINYGQRLFWSQAMNLASFRRNCFQLMYNVVLTSEEGA